MTAIDALLALLGRVGDCRDTAVLVNDEELLQWPRVAVKAMKSQRLIMKARPASSVICPGCESNCVMPLHTLPATTDEPSSFIVCDKRSDINRVPVPPGRMIQWQSNARREASKLDTQAMYERWRKEYRALRRKRPGMSDVWYSCQIAKMGIAKGREAETIRKRMKKYGSSG